MQPYRLHVPVVRDASMRVRLSLAMVAFAYLAALSRKEWSRASTLLRVFQRMVRDRARFVVAAYPPSSRGKMTAHLRRLEPTGELDEATRLALSWVLLTGWRNDLSVLDPMPREPGALGEWFQASIVEGDPRPAERMFGVDELVQGLDEADLEVAVSEAVRSYIDGQTSQAFAEEQGFFKRAADRAKDVARDVLLGRQGRPIPVNGRPELGAVELDPELITPSKPDTPVWIWVAVGSGLVVSAALLLWGAYDVGALD